MSAHVDELSEGFTGLQHLRENPPFKRILWADRTDIATNHPTLPRWPDDEDDDEMGSDTQETF